ncbi:MAG: hypothetical protein AAF360_07690, partial [Pseudomonadota bacterium]
MNIESRNDKSFAKDREDNYHAKEYGTIIGRVFRSIDRNIVRISGEFCHNHSPAGSKWLLVIITCIGIVLPLLSRNAIVYN